MKTKVKEVTKGVSNGVTNGKKILILVVGLIFCMCINIKVNAQTYDTTGTSSRNASSNDYDRWSSVINSYLVLNNDGTYTRVEAMDNKVILEKYSSNFTKLSINTISNELSIFGGFYSGANYNYFVYGQNNPSESPDVEVIRIVKYSKDFVRLGSASLRNCNTVEPFWAGSLRMCEYGDMLYIRTCHKMYAKDGINHQANLTISLRQSDCNITDYFAGIWNISNGYVSHSFNQFILADNNYGRLVGLDHGDANPRSMCLGYYSTPIGNQSFNSNYNSTTAFYLSPASSSDYNTTRATIGGLEDSTNNYLVAGASVGQDANYYNKRRPNIFVSIINKGNIQSVSTKWYTSYNEYSNILVYTPQLIKLPGNRYMLMWEEADLNKESYYSSRLLKTVHYVIIDEFGNQLTSVNVMPGCLSDCKPIVSGDKVVWYYTKDSSPVFKTVNIDGSNTNELKVGDSIIYEGIKYKIVKYSSDKNVVRISGYVKKKYETDFRLLEDFDYHEEKFYVEGIEDYAFKNSSLINVVIPKEYIYFGKGIFDNCLSLHIVYSNSNVGIELPSLKKSGYEFNGWSNTTNNILINNSSYNLGFTKYTIPEKVSNPRAISKGYNVIKLSYNKVYKATEYQVFASEKRNGTYVYLDTVENTYSGIVFTGFTPYKPYYFKVRAVITYDSENKVYGEFSSVVGTRAKLSKTTNVVISSSSSKSKKITWNKVNGASGYEIYVSNTKYGKYTKVANIYSGSQLSKTVNTLVSNKQYYYKVKAYRYVNKVKMYGEFSSPRKG